MRYDLIVHGVEVNQLTQCAHYHSERDVVAVRFKCCDAFYACIHCHEAVAGHAPVRWSRSERETMAILCGRCRGTMSISTYLGCDNLCPSCGAAFNPGCANHYEFYFEL